MVEPREEADGAPVRMEDDLVEESGSILLRRQPPPAKKVYMSILFSGGITNQLTTN